MYGKKHNQKKNVVKVIPGLDVCFKMLEETNMKCSDDILHDESSLMNDPAVTFLHKNGTLGKQTKDVGTQVNLCGCCPDNIFKNSASAALQQTLSSNCEDTEKNTHGIFQYNDNIKDKVSHALDHRDTIITNTNDELLASSLSFQLSKKSRTFTDKKGDSFNISSSEDLSFTHEDDYLPDLETPKVNRILKEVNKNYKLKDFKTPQTRQFSKLPNSCINPKKNMSLNISSSEEISFTLSDSNDSPNIQKESAKCTEKLVPNDEDFILNAISRVSLSEEASGNPKIHEKYALQKNMILLENKNGYSFLKSLSPGTPIHVMHPAAKRFVTNFSSTKVELGQLLFDFFNEKVFSGKLILEVPIVWNAKLTKTGGLCFSLKNNNRRSFRIELSVKVCNSPDRVRDVLIHEMCHAFVWTEYGSREGHGSKWNLWASKALLILKDLPPVTRCHSYSITTKYNYKCSKCGFKFGRHSKLKNIECKYCSGLIQSV